MDKEESYADILLDKALSSGTWDERDKRLLVELVQGTLRWRGFLDYVLGETVTGGLERLDSRTRNLLRLGAYQLLKTEKIPAYAVVNESVKLAKTQDPRAGTLTNAVLHAIIKRFKQLRWPSEEDEPARFLAVKGSHPEWLVRRWIASLGCPRARSLCQADNSPAKTVLRTNRLRITPQALQEKLEGEGFSAEAGTWCAESLTLEKGSPAHSQSFQEGLFQVQDEASTLVGKLLDPRPGEFVVDLCAAPGGKATHLAEEMEDRGTVLACDLYPKRLLAVRENTARLGLQRVLPVAADGRWLALKRRADRVLVDAPCSGTGVLRRRTDLRWKLKEEDIGSLADLQGELLNAAGGMLGPGGVLVYSTCTLEPEENEGVVGRFLAGQPGFVIEGAGAFVPAGVVEPEGWMKTYPDLHGVDGGFAVRLRKMH